MPKIWKYIDSDLFFISGEHGDGLVSLFINNSIYLNSIALTLLKAWGTNTKRPFNQTRRESQKASH